MDLSRLTEADLFGRFLLKASDGGRFAGYYRSLDAIRPLLYGEDWLGSVTGFYVNVAGDFDSVRLSYFTATPNCPRMVVDQFASENQVQVQVLEPPLAVRISDDYGGEELRFRRFLSSYSPLGLDLMQADLLHARCLCITLRCQLFPERRPYRPHLEPTMVRESPTYAALSLRQRDQFWANFQYWPNPPQVEWAHMFVNLVLGFDFNGFFQSPPPRAATLVEINELLTRFDAGFQIPNGWEP